MAVRGGVWRDRTGSEGQGGVQGPQAGCRTPQVRSRVWGLGFGVLQFKAPDALREGVYTINGVMGYTEEQHVSQIQGAHYAKGVIGDGP